MAEARLPSAFTNQVVLSCRAEVGGEKLEVRVACVEAAYNDPVAREHIEASLRDALMRKILEKWTPVIRVTR